MPLHGLVLFFLALLLSPQATATRNPAAARALRYAALDQQAALNFDSALVLTQAALRADPSYLPAQFDYRYLRHTRYEQGVLRDDAATLAGSNDAAQRCFGIAISQLVETRSAFAELNALVRSAGPTTCSTVFLAVHPTRPDFPDSLKRALLVRAVREAPELEVVWGEYAGFLMRSGEWDEAARILEQGRQAVQHPLLRLHLAITTVGLRLARGDTVGALAQRRALLAAAERDGRPGLFDAYLEDNPCSRNVWESANDHDATQRRSVERPRVRGDWAWVERTLLGCGRILMARGDPAQALEYLNRAIPIADSMRLPDLYLETYLQRARAYSLLGHPQEAERDLQRALTLGAGAGWLYNLAQAQSQLAYIYEAAGRWTEASRAIDRSVALTKAMDGTYHLSSLFDAGEIRWKAGWHASARAAFEEMVRETDQLDAQFVWAGRYYERIGDLQRARQYYEKARASYGWNTRAQSALASVYEQLGQWDSAAAIARQHDAQEALWPPEEIPLRPGVLARRGQSAEAIRLMRAWAERQETRGNLRGATMGFVELARLAVGARTGSLALTAAQNAERHAGALNLADERVRALTLRGLALDMLGRGDSALVVLREAARSASLVGTVERVLEAHTALGDVLATRGQLEPALDAYQRAALVVERVTSSLAEDIDRARYRDRHLLPFDGAVRALLAAGPEAASAGRLTEWSSRRKAAALALATPTVAKANRGRAQVTLPLAQSRLADADVLLDYVVLDSMVAVITITRTRVSVTRLPLSLDSLQSMVERFRRPFVTVYGGRIDLARAHFDLRNAAALHDALIRPIALSLEGKRRLLIVPDGPLHALSFDALVTAGAPSGTTPADYSRARYLLDAYEIGYLPSMTFLETGEFEPLSSAPLLVVSYAAPGAEREATFLRAAWTGGRVSVLEGAEATEQATKSALARFGVVHFAVHGEASARDPLGSHLRLAADSIDDGYLNLVEIAAARLTARLVMLGACETDAGPIYNGEGVMGLARAFLASGAQAVVGTHWPVGPTTADLMRHFYGRLAAGEPPGSALRAAKLALRSARGTSHPFFWAGPVLVSGGA